VDPEDTEALGAALREVIANQELREELRLRGFQRLRLFTWANAVRQTWDVYREVLDRR
jgi:glycosyltransferase involved in cell wall biosynthesis